MSGGGGDYLLEMYSHQWKWKKHRMGAVGRGYILEILE